MPTPTTEQVSASRKKTIDAGGMRIDAFLQPDAADAMRKLLAAGYGASKAAVIARALLDAANNHKKHSTL